MHTGEGYTRVQDELARLLKLYRMVSLDIVEDMMRRSDLESIADAFSKGKVNLISEEECSTLFWYYAVHLALPLGHRHGTVCPNHVSLTE